jgi:hypothetical protein
MVIQGTELTIHGRLCRTIRLRHEGFEFVAHPPEFIRQLRLARPRADIFIFLKDVYGDAADLPFHHEAEHTAIVSVASYEAWWNALDFKVRNKVRKAQKSGVAIHICEPDEAYARGVAGIYGETPIRQGRPFLHYNKRASAIQEELCSFRSDSTYLGAYIDDEMIGFAKLQKGVRILRTVHILAKLAHRDKPVMDLLVAKSVELCATMGIPHLQYGTWTAGGLEVFRAKHGFQKVSFPRYLVPLGPKGRVLLHMGLHRRQWERLPPRWQHTLRQIRSKWYGWRYPLETPTAIAKQAHESLRSDTGRA